jgi:hypothetical protein
VVEGIHHEDEDDSHRYYYNEGTCPTNYLGVLKVFDDEGDDDPHGIFEFVKCDPWVVESKP